MRLNERSAAPVMISLCSDNKLGKEHPEIAALLRQLEYSQPLLPVKELAAYRSAASKLCDVLTRGGVTESSLREALEAFRTCAETDNVLQ